MSEVDNIEDRLAFFVCLLGISRWDSVHIFDDIQIGKYVESRHNPLRAQIDCA